MKKKHKRTTQKKYAKTMINVSLFVMSALAGRSAVAQTLSCATSLDFGQIIPCTFSSNTVVVRPNNTRQVNGCLTAGGAPFSRAFCLFTQTTTPLKSIKISITPATITISTTAGTKSMTVNNFNVITNGGGKSTTVSATFAVSIPIGATLNVNANQSGGTYTGSFNVNANLL